MGGLNSKEKDLQNIKEYAANQDSERIRQTELRNEIERQAIVNRSPSMERHID